MRFRCVILFFLICQPMIAVGADTLDIVTFYYPPYMLKSPSGELSGLHVEIFEECLKPSGIKPVYHIYPIRRSIIDFLRSGNQESYAHLGTSMNFGREIAAGEMTEITLSVGKFKAFAAVQNQALGSKITDIKKLRYYKVAVLRGSAIVPFLNEQGVIPLEVADLQQLFKVLALGRVDVSVVLELSGDYFLHQNPNLKLVKLPEVLVEAPLSFLIAKKHPLYKTVVPLMNKKIKEMKETGKLRKIIEKYSESP